jgi:choline dehydrogenase-like flavoprotein
MLFEWNDDLAIAGRISVEDQKHNVTARKEVILVAAAFQTLKLLEYSGIADKDLFQSHKAPLTIDNPNVGGSLQDHLMTGISFEAIDGSMRHMLSFFKGERRGIQ